MIHDSSLLTEGIHWKRDKWIRIIIMNNKLWFIIRGWVTPKSWLIIHCFLRRICREREYNRGWLNWIRNGRAECGRAVVRRVGGRSCGGWVGWSAGGGGCSGGWTMSRGWIGVWFQSWTNSINGDLWDLLAVRESRHVGRGLRTVAGWLPAPCDVYLIN